MEEIDLFYPANLAHLPDEPAGVVANHVVRPVS